MRAALLVLPLALVGCGDSVYYQTRSSPEGGSSYGFVSWLFQSEDAEVYELPSRPPAIDRGEEDTHLTRADCRKPGQPFKPTSLVGVEEPPRTGQSSPDPVTIARMDDAPLAPRSTTPSQSPTMAGWQEPRERGAREPVVSLPVGSYETKPVPRPGTGIGTIPARTMGRMADDERWCPTPNR